MTHYTKDEPTRKEQVKDVSTVDMTPDKRVEEFAKELSASVRWSSGYGQYENGSKERQAYIDGVTTAIGMMYIGLTGTPKSKGMLMEYHQDMMSALLEGLPSMDVDEYVAIIKAGNWDKIYEAGVKASQKQAQDIIRATLSK